MRKLFTLLMLLLTLSVAAQNTVLTWNRDIAIVSATVRRSATGWQFVTPDHDPLGFSGTITATSNALTLDLDFDGFGLNPAEWTPSGVVVGADESYAREGHTFGASVSSTSIVINGCNGIVPAQQIAYNGTSWIGASGYTASWNASLQCLELVRNLTDNSNYRQGIQAGGVPGIALQPNTSTLSQLFYNVAVVENSNTRIRIAFFYNGVRVTTPDTNCKIMLTDFAKREQSFDFTSNVTALQTNANLWLVGTFVKIGSAAAVQADEEENKLTAYPNPSTGAIRLTSGSASPVCIYDMNGKVVYRGSLEEMDLDAGMYVIEQDGCTTRVTITQ